MRITRWPCQLPILLALCGTALPALSQQASAVSPCTLHGESHDCVSAVASAWRYHVSDALNDLTFDDEASAYAYLLRSRQDDSIFALAYRWGKAEPQRYPVRYTRGVETASWKIYQRCSPGEREFDCDRHPEYLGYQRLRTLKCPDGYGFRADDTSPFCVRNDDAAPLATSRSARIAAR